MGRRYMLMEEIRKEEFKAGKTEGLNMGLLLFLNEIAPVSNNLEKRISSINSIDILTELSKKAVKVKSIEEFETILDEMNI